jgi:RNA polymerase sigma factor (sigma-70 family)
LHSEAGWSDIGGGSAPESGSVVVKGCQRLSYHPLGEAVPDDIDRPNQPGPLSARPPSPEETVTLLQRIRAGDDAALNALLVRLLPRLRRWAHGRLPASARGVLETGDIVQSVAARAVRRLGAIQIEHSAALGSYLRQAIANEIADHWRRVIHRPAETSLNDSVPAVVTSPLERLIGAERVERYEAALRRLPPAERETIIGRFELAYGYEDLARYLGKPSVGAARVAVHRAVKRLTEEARHV